MPFVQLNGIKSYYEDYGQGPAVVLLHHGFGSSEMWRGVLPTLVGAGFRAVMYDRRGYGQSGQGDNFREFFLSDRFRPEMVQGLAALARELGLESFHLVGQCEGGVLALDYALRFPQQVKSLVVASTMCHSSGASLLDFNKEKFPLGWDELDDKVRKKMIGWQGAERAQECYELFSYLGGAYGTGIFDLRPMLPAIEQPSLILYPDRSALFEVEQAVDFYRSLPNAELAVIPKCGHNSYENKPQEYLRLLMNFLHRQEHGEEPGFSAGATCAG
jgi:pimeloyl-ACP methyl ester carboxylesterase